MKIGIDIDGVIIDSATTYRVYEEIFAIEELNMRNIKDRLEPNFQGRYDWNEEEQNSFTDKYVMKATNESNFMPGFFAVYEKLRKMGHEFIVITARGGLVKQMEDDTKELFMKYGLNFDKCYFEVSDKLEICKKENIDIMIDDDYANIERLISGNVKTLYFRDTGLKKIENSEYVREVNNWGDIYRYFKEVEDKVCKK